jgi:hypothetical protein
MLTRIFVRRELSVPEEDLTIFTDGGELILFVGWM